MRRVVVTGMAGITSLGEDWPTIRAAFDTGRTGVRVMPGAFMGVEETPGVPESNPGFSYVRVALVHDSMTIEAALGRVAEFLQARHP